MDFQQTALFRLELGMPTWGNDPYYMIGWLPTCAMLWLHAV